MILNLSEQSQSLDMITYEDPEGRLERERILAQLSAASPSQRFEQAFEQINGGIRLPETASTVQQVWHLIYLIPDFPCYGSLALCTVLISILVAVLHIALLNGFSNTWNADAD